MKKMHSLALFLALAIPIFSFSQYEMYEKVEIQLDESTIPSNYAVDFALANPYNKEEVEVEVTVYKPDGTYEVIYAYYYENYNTSTNTNGQQHPDFPNLPRDQVWNGTSTLDGWFFRYAPRVIGGHSYHVRVHLHTQNVTFQWPTSGTFEVEPNSTSGEYGHVYLVDGVMQHANSKGFNPIGLNIPTGPVGIMDDFITDEPRWSYYDKFFERMAENNANFVRIWVNFWTGVQLLGVNFDDGVAYIDSYSGGHAKTLDLIIEKAEERGIKLQFCFFNSNNLSTKEDDNGNSAWGDANGFNEVNGGPCAEPAEFYTNAEARTMQKNLIRYCIDRWGYSKAIMSWELTNEVDATPGIEITSQWWHQTQLNLALDIIDWHEDLGAVVHQYDIYDSPLTSSFLLNSIYPIHSESFKHMDFVSIHRYVYNLNYKDEKTSEIWREHSELWRNSSGIEDVVFQYGEGESLCDQFNGFTGGVGDGLMADHLDPLGYNFHNDLWASSLMGNLGPIMVWELDHLLDGQSPGTPAGPALSAFKGVGEFYKNVPYMGHNSVIDAHYASEPERIRSYYMTFDDQRKTYGWMQDGNYRTESLMQWFYQQDDSNGNPLYTGWTLPYVHFMNPNDAPNRAKTIPNLELSGAILQHGSQKILWYDTETGQVAQVENAVVHEGQDITLMMPDYLRESPFADAAYEIRAVQCGWTEVKTLTGANYEMMDPEVFVESDDKFYFPNQNGEICQATKNSGAGWTVQVLNAQAPKMKAGVVETKGLTVQGGTIYYIAANKIPYKLYQLGGVWHYVPMVNTSSLWKANTSSEIHYRSGKLYYVSSYNSRLVELAPSGPNVWQVVPMWNSAIASSSGGFALHNDSDQSIYYGGSGGQVYRAYKSGSTWYSENIGGNDSYTRASHDSKFQIRNGIVIYQRNLDDKLLRTSPSGSTWVVDWMTGHAPGVASGSNFFLDNDVEASIYYVGFDNNVYRLWVDIHNDWHYEQFNVEHANSGGAVGKIYKINDNLIYSGKKGVTNSTDNLNLYSLYDCETSSPYAPLPNAGSRFAEETEDLSAFGELSVELFPNPNSGSFVIKSDVSVLNKVELLDLSGKVIETKDFETASEKRLYFTNLKNGHYMVRVHSVTGESKVIKFVKI